MHIHIQVANKVHARVATNMKIKNVIIIFEIIIGSEGF